jgi:hypothetical protein
VASFPFAEGKEKKRDGNNKKVKHGRVGGKEGAGIMYVCMCMYSLIE